MSKRFDKGSWIDLGLKSLGNQNLEEVTIDQLCKIAEKTKGSFYFHFKTIEEYLENLTQVWFERYTQEIVSKIPSQTNRTDLLNQLAARLDLNLEMGIRKLALKSGAVQKIVTKADRDRINWLTKLYVLCGKYEENEAKALASIEIAAFTGFRLINPDLTPSQARNYYENFLHLTNRS